MSVQIFVNKILWEVKGSLQEKKAGLKKRVIQIYLFNRGNKEIKICDKSKKVKQSTFDVTVSISQCEFCGTKMVD
jgi:predicted nucleotidyltransferase